MKTSIAESPAGAAPVIRLYTGEYTEIDRGLEFLGDSTSIQFRGESWELEPGAVADFRARLPGLVAAALEVEEVAGRRSPYDTSYELTGIDVAAVRMAAGGLLKVDEWRRALAADSTRTQPVMFGLDAGSNAELLFHLANNVEAIQALGAAPGEGATSPGQG